VVEPERGGPDEGRFFDQPFREFEHSSGGLHLTDSVLWFDADRRRELSFISSAHADFVGKNRRILATEQTVKILTRGSGRIEALTSPYRRSFALGPLELEMHPAGRMLGSAQLLVQRDGRRILYTNDFHTTRQSTCERAKPIECDVLALPATYGRPDFRFPDRQEVLEQIVGFVDRALDEKYTPVLVAPPLGVAQELMYFLGKRGVRIRAHRSIHEVAKVYSELGVNLLAAKRLQAKPARDEVVLVPPILRHATQIRKLERHRTALVSGRAVEPDHVFHMRVDEAFPLAEAADFEELVHFVKATGAEEVYLTSGYVDELADALREGGRKVYPLVRPEQLPLL
jgi:Cft2 family RNA processing exonuclease